MRLGVSVFGSARVAPEHSRYALGVEVGRRISDAGFTVITGGGPGLMQAANQGAAEAGARSIGLTIELPREEKPNPYAEIVLPFEHFFVRKTVFVRYSCAFVVLPGGFGTLDELFESLTLIQTGKLHDFPVILIGTEFWTPALEWLRDSLLAAGTISPGDLDLITVTDDLDEMITVIQACVECHTPPPA
ncbi:MAG: TIGR00730 family Rossman fold protein [Chryseoglobus sp.]|nr:TIGR00730 family Rossman fold protein [Microcella sp.]